MTLLDLLPSLQRGATPRIDRNIWPRTTHVDELGQLCVGGVQLTEVAAQFRTPVYVLDEDDFRHRARRYRAALPDADVVYAGKSLLTTAVAQWAVEEELGLGVCSEAALATALAAGVNPARIVLHGNDKTSAEIQGAIAAGVGKIVVESLPEIALLASRVKNRQPVLIRVAPGTDTEARQGITAANCPAFGFSRSAGQAAAAAKLVLDQPNLDLVGLHCHIGSQLTDAALYGEAIHAMITTMADVRASHGVTLNELNIGGGHGIPYTSGDPELDLGELADVIDEALDRGCAAEQFPRPTVVVEPGRAISARAGVTLHRVLAVRSQPGGRTFVTVDGGMTGTPPAVLDDTKYSVVLCNRHQSGPTQPMTVVGRHREPGRVIARDVQLPTDAHPGDLLAVACTGAYHHSMASNYTMVGRPALVAVGGGRTRELVRREIVGDLLARDRGPIRSLIQGTTVRG